MKMYRNSLRNKLVIFLLCAIIIPITTSIILTYNYTKETVRKDYIRDNTTLLYQGNMNFLNFLNRINQTSLLIYNDISKPKSFYNIVKYGGIQLTEEQEINRSLLFMSNSLQEVKQIFLYIAKEDMSFRVAYSLPRNSLGQTFDPSIPENTDVFIESTHLSHPYGISKFSYEAPEDVITFHRKILDEPSDLILGTLSIDVKMDMIEQISEMLYTSGDEQLYLLNQDGSIIYSSEIDSTAEDISYPWISAVLNQTASSGNYEYKDNNFDGIHLYQSISTPFAQWTLVKRVPYEQLYKNARKLTLMNSLLVSLFLIIAVIATLYISFHFTSPIKQLIRYINKIEAGQLDARIDTHRSDEIGILSRRFHQMMQRLNQLINKEYRLEIANKTNQLKALQAQVNPHFMNNALQSIGTLALQNNEKKIYSLISSLGKMMRYQMNTNDTLVPLSSEIDYVKSYLDLQSQRFDEKLQFFVDIEEETKPIDVPRMIIQPIVENCFKHGFVKQNNVGEIRISARLIDKKQLEITIEDNGVGMDIKQLESIQALLNRLHTWDEGITTNNIGLINVVARLRLYFSKNTQILLEARSPQGLKVTLTIPLEEGAIQS
jgi:two-component system sensor histidine kinase YesM